MLNVNNLRKKKIVKIEKIKLNFQIIVIYSTIQKYFLILPRFIYKMNNINKFNSKCK